MSHTTMGRAAVLALTLGLAPMLVAGNISLTGSFLQDDDVQLFQFSVNTQRFVTVGTLSYAGGTNAAGTVIPRGGFHAIMSLYDNGGNLLGTEGTYCPWNGPDPVSGYCWDAAFVNFDAQPGLYIVALMEYDNGPNGPHLSDGFFRQGQGNFTAGWCWDPDTQTYGGTQFCSATTYGSQRDGHWAIDFLGVDSVAQTGQVPESGSGVLAGLAGLVFFVRAARHRTLARAHRA